MYDVHPHLLRGEDGAPASTVEVADPPAPGSETPDAQVQERPDPAKPESMVPYGALKEERQARRQLEQKFQGLNTKLDALMERISTPTRGAEGGGLDPKVLEEWESHLVKLPLIQRVLKAADLAEQIATERPRDRVSLGIANELYQNQLTNHAMKFYDEAFPVSDEVFAEMVAAKLTPERMYRLMEQRDPSAMQEAIDDTVKLLKKGKPAKPNPVDVTREKEMNKLRSLPKPPGPGGGTPPPPEDAPVTGKKLHDRAFNRLNGFFARAKE